MKFVTKRQAEMIAKGYTWGVYQAYDSTVEIKGKVASVHKTYENALEQSRRLGCLHGITDLSSEPACGDYIEVRG